MGKVLRACWALSLRKVRPIPILTNPLIEQSLQQRDKELETAVPVTRGKQDILQADPAYLRGWQQEDPNL